MAISVLNVATLRHVVKTPPRFGKNLVRPLLSAAVMGIFVWISWFGLVKLGVGSRLILCAAPVLVGVVVYCAAVYKLKVLTRADCLLLPKGEKIAKILHL